MKPVLLLLVGISTSGKTTWAEEFVRNRDDWCNINRDDIRFEMFCGGKRDWTMYKFNKKNEKEVAKRVEFIANTVSHNRINAVISDTNLNPKTREKWRQWAEDNGYDIVHKEFPISWDEAVKRNNQRGGGISQSVLRKQYYQMKEYLGEYVYEPEPKLPDCVLTDIDGNVALKSPDRGYFDWGKVHLDSPRSFVIQMLDGLIMNGVTPIFLSGRDGSCQGDTYRWIYDHIMHKHLEDGGGFHLFMREAGDQRKDYIVKRELFEKYIKGRYNVVGVLDDRPSVINNCWNDMGFPNVISTADQLLEF